jgi:ribosomal protein S18 acetylase RimI-like enzyme
MPPALAAAGYVLRPQTTGDGPFLAHLYAQVRAGELAQVDWPEETKAAFLADQFRLQSAHYQMHYHGGALCVIERAGVPLGRLYVLAGARDVRIVDISLLPEARGAGIGTALLRAVMDEAAAGGRSVSIHVEQFNPAQTLYRRLGFVAVEEKGPYWLMEWRTKPPPGERQDAG